MYGVLWKINYEKLSCLGFIILLKPMMKKKISTLSMVLNLTSVRNMLCSNVFSFKLSDFEKVIYDVET